MINPIRLCNDLFNDEKFFDGDLRSFAEDHLVRLSNPDNNPAGVYNTLITDTTTKYNAYYGKITNQAVKKAIAEGTTITRNNARGAAETKISQLQNLVKFKFGETSSTYQEFYPQGMDEYYQSREGDVGTLFDRFVVAATTHLTADHLAEVTAITNLVAAFHTAYTARETVVSQVDTITTGKHEDRKSLTMQLTKNFLTIAADHIDLPDQFDDYYNPRYLPISETEDAPELEGTVETGQIVNPDTEGITFSPDSLLVFENKSGTTLRIFFSNAPGSGNTGGFFDLDPNGNQKVEVSSIGFTATSQVLAVQNIGGMQGEFVITVLV